jgi:hypothetical protein
MLFMFRLLYPPGEDADPRGVNLGGGLLEPVND